ncbi:hypothetical protein GCM10011579_041850 [Streptomyces albiflavescens]|uniref:Signal transduction histidine kinase subgroup 3 dimerisation and phosphoacceptor domain-containing protein n=1 Tax=Streptomyces albiflavescens TaxID=1623582 RepID=A0A918D5Z1_9ACTN|nr:histidine kinase [Streptomyces albiflavescens]GGN68456.1 hypothetical protein GCM10011579_041850 [Streptomyces albiflavescens]
MTRAAAVQLPLWVAGFALGPATFVLVRARPGQAIADTPQLAALELAAGWGLLTIGLIARLRRPDDRGGVLLGAAGAGSFLAEWANPGITWTPAFSAGLVLYAAGPPLVAHAVLSQPSGRTGSRTVRGVILLAYANAVLCLGLLQAVVYDPWGAGCVECPGNGLLIVASPGTLDALGRTGIAVGATWPCVLVVLLGWRAVRSSPALRRLAAPMWAVGAVYLALVAADYAHSLPRHMLSNDPTDRRLWLAQEVALLLLAAAAAWPWLQQRRTRDALADLVVELAAAPAPGGLRDALARLLGDPSLTLAYPLADGRLVDAQGRPTGLPRPHGGRAVPHLDQSSSSRRGATGPRGAVRGDESASLGDEPAPLGDQAAPSSVPPPRLARRARPPDPVSASGDTPPAPTTVTELVRGNHTLALLGHRPELLSEPGLGPAQEIARISRLALDNERLHAELAARMGDLRASQARIVAAGDAERRRLERDLHDGAQQRLLALALTLRLARAGAVAASTKADEAERGLRAAVAALRALAHGLFPAVLADEGLSAAVGALLEETQSPVEVTALPGRRLGQAVEAAAYFTIAEAVAHHATAVSANVTDGRLLVALDGCHGLDLLRLADRVGALDGTVTAPEPPHTAIRVEIPC